MTVARDLTVNSRGKPLRNTVESKLIHDGMRTVHPATVLGRLVGPA